MAFAWVSNLLKRNTRKGRQGPARTTHPYRAVSVYSRVDACPAARRIENKKFLAAHAPQLPLGGCSNPSTCQCRYRHFEDRRQEIRRDVDHGLPARAWFEADRRHRRDRRKNAA